MKKQVTNFVKKAIKGYCNGMFNAYKPCCTAGATPFC